MQDRFKYRAKSIKNDEWIYGYYTYTYQNIDSKTCGDCIWEENGTQHQIDVSTLGQCTGLKDKNGKLIYEGDIVLLQETCTILHQQKELEAINYIGIVEWGEEGKEGADYSIIGKEYLRGLGISYQIIEIMGNIHENIELLEKRQCIFYHQYIRE